MSAPASKAGIAANELRGSQSMGNVYYLPHAKQAPAEAASGAAPREPVLSYDFGGLAGRIASLFSGLPYAFQTLAAEVQRAELGQTARVLEWEAFVALLCLDAPEAQAKTVRRVWYQLVSTYHGTPPLPRVDMVDKAIRFSWSRLDRFFEIVVVSDGRIEWFFSADGEAPTGTEEEPEDLQVEPLLVHVDRFVPGRAEPASR